MNPLFYDEPALPGDSEGSRVLLCVKGRALGERFLPGAPSKLRLGGIPRISMTANQSHSDDRD
jgi:hypothetical protein